MLRLVAGLGAQAVTMASASSNDCTIGRPLRSDADMLARVIPAPNADGLAVLWQDAAWIYLQYYDRSCNPAGNTVEVNHSEDLWRQPAGNGLADGAGLRGGATAVAWLLGGDVWVRVIHASGSGGPPVLANAPEIWTRSEVRIVADPRSGQGGFVVAWSSWKQDGDGWGVFARLFDANGQPVGEHLQVNSYWQHFQWHPQLTWCGPSLWALYENSTGVACGHDLPGLGTECRSSGPFLRQLTESGQGGHPWSPKDEANANALGDGGAVASAIACDGNSVVALWLQWLEDGGRKLVWQYADPTTQLVQAAAAPDFTLQEVRDQGNRGSLRWLQSWFTSLVPQWLLELRPGVPRASEPFEAATSAVEGTRSVAGPANATVAAVSTVGELAMLARDGLMVALTGDERGSLAAQLWDYRPQHKAVHPMRRIASAVRLVHAAWDEGDSGEADAVVICWVTGGYVEADDPGGVVCIRREVAWLMGSGLLGTGGDVALIAMFSLILLFCCVRHCTQVGHIGRRALLGRLRGTTPRTTRRRRPTRSTVTAELNEQLAQIPMVPVDARAPAAAAVAAAEEAPCEAATPAPGAEACSICQNPVLVRVALRPCGHTACRDCVSRLVEINQRCHICRGSIEGLLPVYI